MNEAQSRDNIETVWIGDSIIFQLQFSSLWSTALIGLHSVNFGIGGDRVEHVLWRLKNGELDFINSKVKSIVLFVGTNNTNSEPKDIADGIVECVRVIREKLGEECHIILPVSI